MSGLRRYRWEGTDWSRRKIDELHNSSQPLGILSDPNSGAMSEHYPFILRAIELALLAEKEGNLPVGAVIAFDGDVVAEGRSAIWVPDFDATRPCCTGCTGADGGSSESGEYVR